VDHTLPAPELQAWVNNILQAAGSSPAEADMVAGNLVLANLSQGGKAAEVKSLIAQFKAAKLTEIPADKYAEVLAAAKEL
jgi:LDH2 family malate/lactate/ureidoglycolate dehydrogenase